MKTCLAGEVADGHDGWVKKPSRNPSFLDMLVKEEEGEGTSMRLWILHLAPNDREFFFFSP